MPKIVSFLPLTFLFLAGAQLQASSQTAAAEPDPVFTLMLVAYNASVAADTASTYALLRSGRHREVNPLLGSFSDRPGPLVALKAGIAVGSTFGLRELRKKRPKLAFWLTVAAIGVHSAATVHNLRQR